MSLTLFYPTMTLEQILYRAMSKVICSALCGQLAKYHGMIPRLVWLRDELLKKYLEKKYVG